ncbi:hypothetical protein SLE2022_262710 [Rubroshorea leprosula]
MASVGIRAILSLAMTKTFEQDMLNFMKELSEKQEKLATRLKQVEENQGKSLVDIHARISRLWVQQTQIMT